MTAIAPANQKSARTQSVCAVNSVNKWRGKSQASVSAVCMKWLSRRRDGKLAVRGKLRFKYLQEFLPDRLLIRVPHFYGIMNLKSAVDEYGDWFVAGLYVHGYDLEITLQEGEK